jgi:heat shock protein HslJ
MWTPVVATVVVLAQAAVISGSIAYRERVAPTPILQAPGDAPGAVALLDTAWRLVDLGGRPVSAPAGPHEPFLRFAASGMRVTGATGCNTFGGGYSADDRSLRFQPLITTRMHCPDAMKIETGMLEALGDTTTWRIVRGQLELLDAQEQVVARFDPAGRM